MFNFDSSQEGSALLYDGLTGWSLAGSHPLKVVQNVQIVQKNPLIGYLSYPNPTLRNEIPNQLFYEYDRLIRARETLPKPKSDYSTFGRLEQSVTKAQYFKKIHQIKELFAEGSNLALGGAVLERLHGYLPHLFKRSSLLPNIGLF